MQARVRVRVRVQMGSVGCAQGALPGRMGGGEWKCAMVEVAGAVRSG